MMSRRAVLIAAGTAAGAAAARPVNIQGAVVFAGGAVIPEGLIEIYLEDPAIPDKAKRRVVELRAASDGMSKAVAFSLVSPEGLAGSPAWRVVARLERVDGWLLARGSAQVSASAPVQIVLRVVMY